MRFLLSIKTMFFYQTAIEKIDSCKYNYFNNYINYKKI